MCFSCHTAFSSISVESRMSVKKWNFLATRRPWVDCSNRHHVYVMCCGRSGAAIHHSQTRFRLKRDKLMYSTHHDSCHAESHHHRSVVNRAMISWHYLLLMLCSTFTDRSLPVRCDRIVAGRRQLSGPVGRLDGTRRRWSGSFVAGNWTTLRASYASWLINHVALLLQRQKADLLRHRPRCRRWRIKPTAKYFYRSSSCALIFSSVCRSTHWLMTHPGIFMTQLYERHFIMPFFSMHSVRFSVCQFMYPVT